MILVILGALTALSGCVADPPPKIGLAVAGNSQATVSWQPPLGVPFPTTSYEVTAWAGQVARTRVTFSSTATTGLVTGLTNGTTYTFTVKAFNTLGNDSASSAASNPVTPSVPWNSVPASPTPSARSEMSMAFDAVRGETVVFGGLSSVQAFVSETWVWAHNVWTLRLPQHSPSARSDAAMAFDPSTGKTILFGGTLPGGIKAADTWSWDGTDWTQLTPTSSPSARAFAAMAFDPTSGELVLFGGSPPTGSNNQYLNDTWLWNGFAWQQSSATGPVGRIEPAMATNPATSTVVMFGGITNVPPGVSHDLNDTWEWFNGNWVQRTSATSPSPRYQAGLAYSPADFGLVLFGGYDFSGANPITYNETWRWNGVTWTQFQPTAAPGARRLLAMTYDSSAHQLVLFGGVDTNGHPVDATVWTRAS